MAMAAVPVAVALVFIVFLKNSMVTVTVKVLGMILCTMLYVRFLSCYYDMICIYIYIGQRPEVPRRRSGEETAGTSGLEPIYIYIYSQENLPPALVRGRGGMSGTKWFQAGVSRGSPPIFGEGDTLEILVYDDSGNPQGTLLIGVLERVGTHRKGTVVAAIFLVAAPLRGPHCC